MFCEMVIGTTVLATIPCPVVVANWITGGISVSWMVRVWTDGVASVALVVLAIVICSVLSDPIALSWMSVMGMS